LEKKFVESGLQLGLGKRLPLPEQIERKESNNGKNDLEKQGGEDNQRCFSPSRKAEVVISGGGGEGS